MNPEQMKRDLETEALFERKRRRRRKILRIVISWLFVLLLIVVILIGAVAILRAVGERSLRGKVGDQKPVLQQETAEPATDVPEESEPEWKEGWVRHNGKIYEYNDDVMTFLIMGIDKESEVTESKDDVSGGQADALFLLVADPDDESISVVAINRDTMTEIDMYGYNGAEGYGQVMTAQIATQHGFGDGKELSCELTRDTVSELFYDLPIHGYVAVNMSAIPEINDAVGGVDVTVLEDMTKKKKAWKEGEQITLLGKDAFWYVKWRDTTVFESNRGRLARQKQYLTAFIDKAIDGTKKDLTLPVNLYNKLSKYMVTDISVDEVAYLAGELINYSFDADEIYTLAGETRMGEKHEEFYPDYDALKDLMIEVFYQEAEQSSQMQ